MAITISGENNNDKILASDGVIDQLSGFSIVGVITATSFTGDVTGNLTGNVTGNINNSTLLLQTGSTERFRITGNNELGIAGANYGSSGQVLTSGGSGSAVTWSAIPTQVTIANNADNRVITGGSGVNLNGEANLTFNGTVLGLQQSSPDGINYVLDAVGGAIFTKTGTFTSNDFNKGHLTLRNTTASQGAFLDLRATSSGGALGVIAKIGGFNTYSGSGYDGALTFSTRQNSTNTMVERLRITHDGRLLVNTSSSRTIANVLSKVQLEGTTADASSISITRNSNNAYPAYLVFGKSRGTSNGGSTIIQDDDNLGVIRFSGADGNDLTNYAAAINANVDGTPGNNVTPGRLVFSTTSSTGSDPTERLRIDSSGRVLIGSTAKAGDSALQVYTSDKLHPAIRTNSTSANGYTMFSDAYTAGESQVNMGIAYSSASLVLSVGCKVNTSNDDAYVSSQGTYNTRPTVLRLDTDGSLSFLNRSSSSTTPTDNAVTLTERFRITSDGEVRIPTGSNSTSRLTFGGGINIYHDGNMKFENGTGYLKLQSNNAVYIDGSEIYLRNAGGTERLRIKSDSSIVHTRTDNVQRYDVEFRNTGGISDGNYGGIKFTQGSSGQTGLAAIEIAYANTGRPDIVFRHRDRGGGTTFDEAMRITSNGKIGINNNSPECRSGGIDMSSNVGTSGKSFTDLRGESQLIIRNPSTTQHSFTQLLFENGGGTSAATMFRHRLGPSSGSQQNFVGDLCLFRRTGNAGGANNDYRESTRWCGATDQARQIWWASGDTDTSGTSRLGWHHLSASRDHPGTDAYTFFRLETGSEAYARNGFGKYTVVWTTGHASGYGLQIGHFGYYMPHGAKTLVVNEHIIHRERYSNGSYYGWNDSPGMRIINNTASGGTNAAISFRCGGRRHAGFDMGVVVGIFIDLYAPESANGDSNPRLYVAGNSESNLSGGGFGTPVSHAYVSFQSTNPNHSGQP